jgi:hypothetical protein
MAYKVVDIVTRSRSSKRGDETPTLETQLNALEGKVISVMLRGESSHSGFVDIAAYRVVLEV